MINITDKSQCCGCNACVQCCPKQCLTMHEDEEGFLYPRGEEALCIDCGLCEKLCLIINQNNPRQPLKVFVGKNTNENQRLFSSSGGVFVLLAEQIINSGGVVFGARFDKNWEVEHCYVETREELEPLMRSKYVQSKIGNTYKEAEQFLKQGRKVLFVGTSCQIAGLHKFLRREYDNLLAVDFICHGVPSPGVWRKYLQYINENFSRSEMAGKNSVLSFSLKSIPVITGINFREKQLDGYGWKKFGFVVHGKLPSKGNQNTVLLSTMFGKDAFMKAFLQNLILRPSCYACPSKEGRSCSDITLGDAWGVWNKYPEMDDDKGLSMIAIYTVKGEQILKDLNLELLNFSYKDLVKYNSSICCSVYKPRQRELFWTRFPSEGFSCIESIVKSMQPSLLSRIFNGLKQIMK